MRRWAQYCSFDRPLGGPCAVLLHVLGLLLWAWVLATSVSIVIAHRSDVPFWDMWDGALGFYLNQEGSLLERLWALHNEHRIVWSRVLFWMEYRWFGGTQDFLLAVNTALMMLSSMAILYALVFRRSAPARIDAAWILPGWILASLPLWWVQFENLTWAFQSQFYLAYLLPLLSLLALAAAHDGWRPGWPTAWLLAVCSAGSMANGLVALPMLTVFALWLRASPRYLLLCGISTVLVWTAYFWGYESPAHHGSLLTTLQTMPGQMLQYLVWYWNSPWVLGGHLSIQPHDMTAIVLAVMLAVFAAGLAIWHAWLRQRGRSEPWSLALLMMAGFVLAASIATAGGRAIFGAEQALTSRYTTPVLLGWSCLIGAVLLLASSNTKRRTALGRVSSIVLFPLAWIMSSGPNHVDATALPSAQNHVMQRLGTQALVWGIDDSERTQTVTYAADRHTLLAQRAALAARDGRIAPLGSLIFPPEQPPVALRVGSCEGYLEGAMPLPVQTATQHRIMPFEPISSQDPGQSMEWDLVRGWIHLTDHSSAPWWAWIFDDRGPVGVVAVGLERRDVANARGEDALYSGFVGYLHASARQTPNLFIVEPAEPPVRCAEPLLRTYR